MTTFPLTDVQRAYWFGRSPVLPLGTIACDAYWEIDGTDIDLDRLERAWHQVVRRHEALRTIVLDSGVAEVRVDPVPYRIARADLRGLDPAAQDRALAERRAEIVDQILVEPLFDVRASILVDRIRIHLKFDCLACDASSFAIVMEDWRHYYHGGAALPALELSFRDVVVGQEQAAGGARRRSEAYWRERITSLPAAPALPARDARRRTSPSDLPFRRRHGALDRDAWGRLKARAERAGVSPTVIALSVYADVLATWSQDSAFTVVLTVMERAAIHPHVRRVVGDFTTTLPLEIGSRAPSFGERAEAIQDQLYRDLDHRHYSGVRVLGDLRQARGESATRGLVVLTSALGLATPAPPAGWLGRRAYGSSRTPQVLLDVQVFELDGELCFNWDAVEDLFEPNVLDRMVAAFGALLRELADRAEPWTRTGLAVTSGADLDVQTRANATQVSRPPATLHGPVFAKAAERPDAIAVITPSRTLRYAELGAGARALGRKLTEHGARPDELVAVVMDKGWEQVVATLGVMHAGAAYLPIDPELPGARRRYLLDNGRVRVAVTQPQHAAKLEGEVVACVIVDEQLLEAGRAAGRGPAPAARPDHLAYCIYTSGSTGQPKGVMIDHGAAANTIADINARFAVGPDDKVFGISSLSFDLSVWDIFGTLAAGGTLLLPGPGRAAARDPGEWTSMLAHRPTIWNSVPILLQMALEHPEAQAAFPPDLRLAMLSGDWIPLTLPPRIRATAPDARIVSLGGATEASIWSIVYPIRTIDPGWRSIPYGRPMSCQSFHVFSDRLEPRPIGVTGELYIGGVGLARGYWADDDKTRAAFIAHPVTGERLYRTGDLGRYLPDGNIEFLGRRDSQVKIRGHRIELGEIETTLAEHDTVDSAVAVVSERGGTKGLVAFVAPRRQPAEAATDDVAWPAIVATGREAAERATGALHPDQIHVMEAMALDCMAATLHSLGVFRQDEPLAAVDVMARTGVIPQHHALVVQWLEALADSGRLRRAANSFAGTLASRAVLQAAWRSNSTTDRPPDHIERLLERAMQSLAGVLRGTALAQEILFPEGELDEARTFYESSPLHEVSSAVVRAMARQRGGTLRVLEIGAGTGGTTSALLPVLDPDRTEYVFTDVGMLDDAARRFAESPFVRFQRYDIEDSPFAQGFAPHSFDVIVGGGALHVARDLARASSSLRRLLHPDGLLLLEEAVDWGAFRLVTLGPLLDLNEYAGRGGTPLLDVPAWKRTLEQASFDRVAAFCPADPRGVVIAACAQPNAGLARLEAAASQGELAGFLRTRLPEEMIPQAIVPIESLPVTDNGKIDRKALAAMSAASPSPSPCADAAPSTPIEQQLTEIWSKLLGNIEHIGIRDDFFALGGNSLSTIRLVAEIERAFGVRIPVRTVFEHPTIEALAAYASRVAPPDSEPSRRVVHAPTGATQARATVGQEYFWYLDRDDRDPESYYTTTVFVIDGPLDPALLARSHDELVARHGVYRTVCREVDGVLQQIMLPAGDAPPSTLEVVDRSPLAPEHWNDEFARAAAELGARGYDLARGIGLVRSRLIRLAPDRHGLVLMLHHIAADGATIALFRTHLFEGHARLRAGEATAHAAEPPLHYIDYAHAGEQWAATPAGTAHRDFWTTRVKDAPPLELEGDFPRGPIDARRDVAPLGITADSSHPPELLLLAGKDYAAVQAAARAAGTSPFVVFMAGLAWLLHERSGQTDLTIQCTHTPRADDPVLDPVHGCIATWMPVRIDIAGAAAVADAIGRTRAAVQVSQDQGAPYDYYRLVPHTLRRAVFNYVPLGASAAPGFGDVTVKSHPWRFPPWKRPWDLHLTLVDDGASARLVWTGFQQLFRRETVAALLRRYVEILREAIGGK